jgi:hypothetical protein
MAGDNTFGAGETNPRSRYTAAQVRRFKQLVAEGYSTRGAAILTEIAFEAARDIRKGRTWGHIPSPLIKDSVS